MSVSHKRKHDGAGEVPMEKKTKPEVFHYKVGDPLLHREEGQPFEFLMIVSHDDEHHYTVRELLPDPKHSRYYLLSEQRKIIVINNDTRGLIALRETSTSKDAPFSQKRWFDPSAGLGGLDLIRMLAMNKDTIKWPQPIKEEKKTAVSPVSKGASASEKKEEKKEVFASQNFTPFLEAQYNEYVTVDAGFDMYEQHIPDKLRFELIHEGINEKNVVIMLKTRMEQDFVRMFKHHTNVVKCYPIGNTMPISLPEGQGMDLVVVDNDKWLCPPSFDDFCPMSINLIFQTKKFANKSIFCFTTGWKAHEHPDLHKEVLAYVRQYAGENGYDIMPLSAPVKYGLNGRRLLAIFRVTKKL